VNAPDQFHIKVIPTTTVDRMNPRCQVLDNSKNRITTVGCVYENNQIRVYGAVLGVVPNIDDTLTHISKINTTQSNTLACPTGQQFVEWQAQISLHGAIPIFSNEPVSFENAKMDPLVASYNGQRQEFTIPIRISCTQSPTQTSTLRVCDTNRLISEDCSCGGTLCQANPSNLNTFCSMANVCRTLPAGFNQYVNSGAHINTSTIRGSDGNLIVEANIVKINETIIAYCTPRPADLTRTHPICLQNQTCQGSGANAVCIN
jgi:hypothetical protein